MKTIQYAPIDQEILTIADSKIEEAGHKMQLLKHDGNEYEFYTNQLLVGIRLRQLVESDY